MPLANRLQGMARQVLPLLRALGQQADVPPSTSRRSGANSRMARAAPRTIVLN